MSPPFLGQAPPLASGDPDGMRARLVSDPDDRESFTIERRTDCRTALARGLKEYIEQYAINWNGRLLQFSQVFWSWSQPEVVASYPALAIVADMPGSYGDATMVGRTFPVGPDVGEAPREHLRLVAAFVQEFHLTVWATEDDSRGGLVSMLEDLFEPNDFMTGLRLELPYYFNARATFEKKDLMYQDNASDVATGWRKALVVVMGEVSQYVPVGKLAPGRTIVRTEVTAGGPDPATVSRIEGVEIHEPRG